ncbi:uncharacterized protein LOC127723525 [Mytilus californianus]|uniref:uncharacterized protein LOC127723525 n=1 Tax=Mytilus californianus TaxID=6549 RepID=UPI002245971E|nr:uncharacterized protein LOC127723525 [Mytilus californianus]
MDLKLSCFLVVLASCASFTIAQKRKTTVTGDLTKDKDIGTRVDLGISHQRGNWGFEGTGFGTSRGHRGGSLGISHKRKNLEFGGSVFGDNRGNRGAKLGFKWKFGKRSAAWTGEHFEVRVIVNHCDFNVYDINEDSVITVDEIYELFPQRNDAHKLFKALDSTSVDGKVTIGEFKLMAPQVIKKCEYNKYKY